MKIEAQKLKSFVDKASLNNKMMGVDLNFTEEGLTSSIRDPPQIALTNTKMKKEAFEEYIAIGKLYVRNPNLFSKILATFDDVVTIEKTDEYILSLTDGKRDASIILGAEKALEDYLYNKPLPDIKSTTVVNVKKEDLTRAFGDKTLIGEEEITLQHVDKKLVLTIGKSGKTDSFYNAIEVEEEGSGIIKIADSFDALYNCLDKDSNVKIALGDNIPVVFTETTEDIEFTCIIAPRVGDH